MRRAAGSVIGGRLLPLTALFVALMPLLTVAAPVAGEQASPLQPPAAAAVPAGFTTILSEANSRWVSTEVGYSGSEWGMLRARSNIQGPWEDFELVSAGGGSWAIRSAENWLFVTTEVTFGGDDNGMLRARASTIGAWEKYSLVDLGGGSWAIRSLANGLFVSAEISQPGGHNGMLRARASTVGPWERFSFVPKASGGDNVRPVYFVHGFGDGKDCASYFAEALSDFETDGDPMLYPRSLMKTVGFYRGDSNCDVSLPVDGVNQFGEPSQEGTQDESIKELGRELSWEIYNRYSRNGIVVEIVGHSMGGLIARAMLTGTQQQIPGFAPFVFVDDVATLSTPHGGALIAFLCQVFDNTQCNEMQPGSETLQWMDDSPQSDIGTEWTLVGADDDEIVSAARATQMSGAGHKSIYTKPQPGDGVEHGTIHKMTSGTFSAIFCDLGDPCDMNNRDTWPSATGPYDPVRTARYAVFWTGLA